MNTVCFYHGGGCVDGFTAAWVVQRADPDAELVPVQCGDGLPAKELYAGKDVYIVDFSYPPDQLAVMAADAHTVVMLDHHESAIRKWNGQPTALTCGGLMAWGDNVRIVFDIRHSGAKLAWDHFFPNTPTTPLVQYVQDRDLWKWELPDSHAVNAYIRTRPFTIEEWDELCESMASPPERQLIAQYGRVVLEREQQIIDRAVKHAVTRTVAGFDVPVVNTTELTSEIGHALCQGRPFAVMYFDNLKAGKRILSFRSDDGGQDVSKVAESFNGGGHKHAAGAEVPLTHTFN